MSSIANYIQLTKPNIVLLVVITALAALAAEGSLFQMPMQSLLIVAAIGLAAGSANAFNQFLDRDIDSVMGRTKKRRPLPTGKIKPAGAFIFASALGALSTVYLWLEWNPLAAMVSASTILFYTLIYTLMLKRNHHYNIVIGGAAGAAGPIIAWAAVDGYISLYAWIMFMVIFMWTPAHFWALALAIKDEYKEVSVPMLPVTHGDKRTRWEILLYTISLLPLSFLPVISFDASYIYLAGALLLWAWYMKETIVGLRAKTKKAYMKLFYVSILYLFLYFLVIGIDGGVRYFL